MLQDTLESMKLEFSAVKASSDYSTNKLKQVEAGMEGLDIPAYTEAILELARNVNFVLHSNTLHENESTTGGAPTSENPEVDNQILAISSDPQCGTNDVVDMVRVVTPSVVIITDLDMCKDHIKYVEQKLGNGPASLIETPPPFSDWGLDEVKHQLSRTDLSASKVVMFSFSTMDVRDYSYEAIENFVMFTKNIAVKHRVKVIVSCLPPKYVGRWEEWQYEEHWDTNDCIIDMMMQHQVGRVGVCLTDQVRLSCQPGKARESRFRKTGELSDHGIFLFLKNMVAVPRSPINSSRESSHPSHGTDQGWDMGIAHHTSRGWGAGEPEVGKLNKLSDKKLMRLLQSFLKKHSR